jgi:Domain of unknown function (DUF6970)
MTKMSRTLPLIILAFAGVVFFSSCEKSNLKVAVPSCVEKKIREIKRQEMWNPPAQVWKWEVDGKTYFYFTSDCCDQFNLLYDENCNLVCAPDGGFTGSGDGNCPDFEGNIVKALVWKDDGK